MVNIKLMKWLGRISFSLLILVVFICFLLIFLTFSIYLHFNTPIVTIILILLISVFCSIFFIKKLELNLLTYKMFKLKVSEEETPLNYVLRYELIPGKIKVKEFIKPFLYLLFLILLSIDIIFLSGYISTKRLTNYKDKLKKEGFPLTFSEFQKPCIGKNNTFLDSRLNYKIQKFKTELNLNDLIYRFDYNYKLSKKEKEKISSLSGKYETFLEKEVYPDIENSNCFKEADYISIKEIPYRYIELSKAILIVSFDKFINKNYQEGWKHIQKALKLQNLLNEDINLNSKLLSFVMGRQILFSLLTLKTNFPDIIIPHEIREEIKRISLSGSIREGLKAEILYYFKTAEDMRWMAEDFTTCSTLSGSSGILENILSCIIEKYISFSGLTNFKSLKGINLIYNIIQDRISEKEARITAEKLYVWPLVLASISFPDFTIFVTKEKETKTLARFTLTYSNLREYYKKTNKYPEKITDLLTTGLGEDMMTDGMTNEMFLYKLSDDKKSFKLCSEGLKGYKMSTIEDGFCIGN